MRRCQERKGLIDAGPGALADVVKGCRGPKARSQQKSWRSMRKPACFPISQSGTNDRVSRPQLRDMHAKEGGNAIPNNKVFRAYRSLDCRPAQRLIRPQNGLDPARLRMRAHHRHRQGRPAHPEAKEIEHVSATRSSTTSPCRDFQRKTSKWTPCRPSPHRPATVPGSTADEMPAGRVGSDHDASQRETCRIPKHSGP